MCVCVCTCGIKGKYMHIKIEVSDAEIYYIYKTWGNWDDSQFAIRCVMVNDISFARMPTHSLCLLHIKLLHMRVPWGGPPETGSSPGISGDGTTVVIAVRRHIHMCVFGNVRIYDIWVHNILDEVFFVAIILPHSGRAQVRRQLEIDAAVYAVMATIQCSTIAAVVCIAFAESLERFAFRQRGALRLGGVCKMIKECVQI